jgi:hypothetical protein
MRMLILRRVVHRVAQPVAHPILDWVAPRERAVPVSFLPYSRPRVCLVVCPGEPGHACLAAVRSEGLLAPCLIPPWGGARSCAPAVERAACP